ncbi:MAG: NAD(P)H-dependent oxidoreductase [Gemmatimonadales bacterium]
MSAQAGRPFTILGIAGSLRKASFNRAALRAARQLVPEGARIEIFELDGIPPFNQDLENDPPPRVKELKAAVRAADALLFVSPEYNYSIPGVLKNAIDWGSRPPKDNCWAGKPGALMGVSGGLLGTARMQYHLRQVFLNIGVQAVARPEVMIGQAAQKFDADLNLTDVATREFVQQLVVALVDWARLLERGRAP